MKDAFKITWEADDGYSGPARPHAFLVRASDVDAETEDEARELFWQLVSDEFRTLVSAFSRDEDDFVAWVMDRKAEAV